RARSGDQLRDRLLSPIDAGRAGEADPLLGTEQVVVAFLEEEDHLAAVLLLGDRDRGGAGCLRPGRGRLDAGRTSRRSGRRTPGGRRRGRGGGGRIRSTRVPVLAMLSARRESRKQREDEPRRQEDPPLRPGRHRDVRSRNLRMLTTIASARRSLKAASRRWRSSS